MAVETGFDARQQHVAGAAALAALLVTFEAVQRAMAVVPKLAVDHPPFGNVGRLDFPADRSGDIHDLVTIAATSGAFEEGRQMPLSLFFRKAHTLLDSFRLIHAQRLAINSTGQWPGW